MTDIRPSPIAGTWYPGTSDQLKRSIDQFLKDVSPSEIPGEILGVVAPHAGYRYSGAVAAHAFRCLEELTPEIVVIVSPLHHLAYSQVLTTGHEAFGTPLGEVTVDHALLEQLQADLRDREGIGLDYIREDTEHSLEIELPFLQRVLQQPFQLVPIMIRDQSQPIVERVGHALGRILANQSAILVASTDLSHFYAQDTANKFDAEVLSRIEAFDPAGVLAAEDEGVGYACGRAAVAAVLWAAKDLGADAVDILNYATSGDVTGDYHSVVGYGAAAIYRQV
jgi:AmmeMemoRadiSam system protein B